jgi:hypothetical protein
MKQIITNESSNPGKWYYSPLLSWALGIIVLVFVSVNTFIEDSGALMAGNAVFKEKVCSDIIQLKRFDSIQTVKNEKYDKNNTEIGLVVKDFVMELRQWRSDDDKKIGAITMMFKQLSGERKDMKELIKYLDELRQADMIKMRDTLNFINANTHSVENSLSKQIVFDAK